MGAASRVCHYVSRVGGPDHHRAVRRTRRTRRTVEERQCVWTHC